MASCVCAHVCVVMGPHCTNTVIGPPPPTATIFFYHFIPPYIVQGPLMVGGKWKREGCNCKEEFLSGKTKTRLTNEETKDCYSQYYEKIQEMRKLWSSVQQPETYTLSGKCNLTIF